MAAVASLVPGLGHLLAGRRRSGAVLLGFTVALLCGLGFAAAGLGPPGMERLAVRSDFLLALLVGLGVLGVYWCAAIVSAYRVARPPGMSRSQRYGSRLVVAGLCATVLAPTLWTARGVYAAREVLDDVFRDDAAERPQDEASSAEPEAPTPSAAPIPATPTEPPPAPAPPPFADRKRVNLLLLGGDGGSNRKGVRTDVLVLVSIDPKSGRTALISLPRNLQNVPLRPGTPLARAFGGKFSEFWFSIYTYAADNPRLMPDVRPENAGAAAIADTVAYATGVDVDYYALVNMNGFRKIVDSLGGVEVEVRSGNGLPIPIGGSTEADGSIRTRPHDSIALGERRLDGQGALWYARSRFGSTDAERQARQRCLLTSMARQLEPADVLTSIRRFTDAASQVLLTNIPADVLPQFIELARRHATTAQIDRVTVLDVIGSSVNPNVDALRDRVRAAVADEPGQAAGRDYGVQRPICPDAQPHRFVSPAGPECGA
ncbi:MAG: LCP family protein [Sporichthyaceae bacterium]